MAKLDLPIRAFVEDFCSKAFPNRAFGRGTAAGDLVVKPMAALLQPLRHEIDAIKVNQSMANYRYMAASDLDALAANWGAFRQTGGVATGTVRLFFDTIADYQLNYLQFQSDDGVTFQLQSPVTIPATALLQNQSTGAATTYSFDVTVVSVGLGNRYTVAANTITRAINPPANLVRVTNPEAFTVTVPNETNYDLVNRLYRDLGLKNRVSRASIRSPIFDGFPGVLDVMVAGATHPKMLRDLQTIRLPDDTTTTLHLGGKADIWLNTINTSTFVQSIGYLPSSRQIRLVSSLQAAAQEAAYTFNRALVTVDSQFAATDASVQPDESMSLQALQAGLPTSATIVGAKAPNGLSRITSADITRGSAAYGSNHATNLSAKGPLLVDPDADFVDLGVTEGDMVYLSDSQYAAVTAVSQKVLEIGLGVSSETVAINTSIAHPKGASLINLSDAPVLNAVGGRMLVASGPAQGYYKILSAVSSQVLKIGTTLSICTLGGGTLVPSIVIPGGDVYDFVVTGGVVDPLTSDSCAVYRGNPTQLTTVSAQNIFPILSVIRGATLTLRVFVPSTGSTSSGTVTIVQALRGALAGTETVSIETDAEVMPLQGDQRTLAQRFTRYANALSAALDTSVKTATAWGASGTSAVFTLNAMHEYSVGQLLTVAATGGAGWSATVRVVSVPSSFSVGVQYDTAPTGSPTAVTVVCDVLEAPGIGATAQPGDVILLDASTATFAPGSTGGGSGPFASLVVLALFSDSRKVNRLRFGGAVRAVFPAGTPYAVQAQGSAYGTATVTASNVGSAGQLVCASALGSGMGDGTGLVVKNPAGEVATVTASTASGSRVLTFTAGKAAQTLTFGTGYQTVSSAQLGGLVSQATGSAVVTGTLVEVDNSAQTWTVVLANPSAPFSVGLVSLASGLGGGSAVAVADYSNGPGGTKYYGYWPPVIGDIGATVRQGTYVGTLTGFTGTTWLVKPATDADLFDSITEITFIDNGPYPGFPVVTGSDRKSCILQVPASTPTLVGGAPTLTLDRTLTSTGSYVVTFYPRFPATGGLFEGSQLRISGATDEVNEFSALTPDTDLQVALGTNQGAFDIATVNPSSLDLTSPGEVEVSRIVTAGSATTTTGTVAAAGVTALTINGTSWGYWAASGRVLVLTVGGTTYYLETAGRGSSDAEVLLRTALPLTINSLQPVTAEVVDGFITPFMPLNSAVRSSYRITRPSAIASDVVPASGRLAQDGTNGSALGSATINGSTFSGGSADYSLAFFRASVEDYFLHIDSGPDASPTPRRITAFAGTSTFVVDFKFTADANNVAYHISRRTTQQSKEGWVAAALSSWSGSSLTLTLLDFDATALLSNNTYARFAGYVQCLSSTVAAVGPAQVVSATSTTVTLLATDPGGLAAALTGQTLRVGFKLADRAQATAITGSLLNTFDYYAGGYMTLPLVRVQKVEQLDSATGQVVRSLPFTLLVNDAGLRYSPNEDNTLFINDAEAVYQPLRITYSADSSIQAVDDFLNDFNTRVENANHMAKRMETILIDLTITVRSTQTASSLSTQIARFINTRPSTQAVSKDAVIQYLYQNELVTGVDTSTFVLNGTYYQLDGTETDYADAATIFGADTACYVAGAITVVLA